MGTSDHLPPRQSRSPRPVLLLQKPQVLGRVALHDLLLPKQVGSDRALQTSGALRQMRVDGRDLSLLQGGHSLKNANCQVHQRVMCILLRVVMGYEKQVKWISSEGWRPLFWPSYRRLLRPIVCGGSRPACRQVFSCAGLLSPTSEAATQLWTVSRRPKNTLLLGSCGTGWWVSTWLEGRVPGCVRGATMTRRRISSRWRSRILFGGEVGLWVWNWKLSRLFIGRAGIFGG